MAEVKTESRYWAFTIDNYTCADMPQVKLFTYLIIGLEVCPTTGTPHFQGFCIMPKKQRLTAMKKILPRAHLEKMYSTVEYNVKYCKGLTKDKTPNAWVREWGEIPSTSAETNKRKWEDVYKAAAEGREEDIPWDVRFRYHATIKRIRLDNPDNPPDNPTTCGLWLWGESGAGKSVAARARYPNLYRKHLNKWWTGYKGQENILVEDVDVDAARWIGRDLLEWADHYAFSIEIKYGGAVIRPKAIIVTSQWTIEELFRADPRRVTALQRRYKEEEIKVTV